MDTRHRIESSYVDDGLASLFNSFQITPRPSYNAVPPPKELLAKSPRNRSGYIPRPKYQTLDSGLDDPYLPYDIDGVSPEEHEALKADVQIGRWKALSSRDSLSRIAHYPPLSSRFVKASSEGSSLSSRPRQTDGPRSTAPLSGNHGHSLRNTALLDNGNDTKSAGWVMGQ